MDIKTKGLDTRRKTATKTGTTAHIFVPKEWIGHEVLAILLLSDEDVEK